MAGKSEDACTTRHVLVDEDVLDMTLSCSPSYSSQRACVRAGM